MEANTNRNLCSQKVNELDNESVVHPPQTKKVKHSKNTELVHNFRIIEEKGIPPNSSALIDPIKSVFGEESKKQSSVINSDHLESKGILDPPHEVSVVILESTVEVNNRNLCSQEVNELDNESVVHPPQTKKVECNKNTELVHDCRIIEEKGISPNSSALIDPIKGVFGEESKKESSVINSDHLESKGILDPPREVSVVILESTDEVNNSVDLQVLKESNPSDRKKPPSVKKIRSGVADFSDFAKNKTEYGFVDKTLLIKSISDKLKDGLSILITRPRRSGKSLNLSMLFYYFSILHNNIYDSIFKDTKIDTETEFKASNANKFPVVALDFKAFESKTSNEVGWPKNQLFISLQMSINMYYEDITGSTNLTSKQKKEFMHLGDEEYQLNLPQPYHDMNRGLLTLLSILKEHYGQKCILLIDEYDAPYNTIVSSDNHAQDLKDFMEAYKNFLQNALKASINNPLHFCVMTGVLKIRHDGLLSGLNNLNYDQQYTKTPLTFESNFFGFNEEEVKLFVRDTVENLSLDETMTQIRSYYNGYNLLHYKESYYNPWSIIKYAQSQMLLPYWENTSTDALLKRSYDCLSLFEKAELAFLIEDDLPIHKKIDDSVMIDSISRNSNLIWTILVHAGYLTFTKDVKELNDQDIYSLKIPNKDAKKAFTSTVLRFEALLDRSLRHSVLTSFMKVNIPLLFKSLNNWIKSGKDTGYTYASEPAYHMFLYQTLRIVFEDQSKTGWEIHSERLVNKSKNRFDVAAVCNNERIYLFEVKFLAINRSSAIRNHVLQEAINQIDRKAYEVFFRGRNLPILKIGVVGQNKTLYFKTCDI